MIPRSLRDLPQLPATSAPQLPASILAGLNAGSGDPQTLVDPRRNPDRGLLAPRYITVLDPDHNLSRAGNAVRRRLLTFGAANDAFRQSLNTQLGGGESSPVLTTALGIGLGLASGGAGIAFSVLATSIDLQRTNQPVRARRGDVIDKTEVLGQRNGKVYHWETYILVDPLRTQPQYQPGQWVIHGQLREVSF